MKRSSRKIAGPLALAGLLAASACEVDRREAAERGAPSDTASTPEASAYWSDEPLPTEEEIERGRYDDAWRRAGSIDSFRVVAIDTAGPWRIPSDSIAIPESWEDIGETVPSPSPRTVSEEKIAIQLPLGGRVAGPSVLRVQVLLDRVGFSPGVIDGRWGKNTEKAVYWLQRREELPPTGVVDSVTYLRLVGLAGDLGRSLIHHVLTSEDVSGPFVEIPKSVYAQAAMDCMCYRSLTEKLAERFHATPEILARLNGETPLDSLTVGDTLLVPAVLFARTVADSVPRIAEIVVSDGGRYVHALDDRGEILFHFPSTLGSRYDPSLTGRLQVVSITTDPWFHHQPELLEDVPDNRRATRIPPGPNSPVGIVWIGLSMEHYGIHGSPDPASIGYEMSSGCVRMTNWDARFLAERISPGVPVRFIDFDAEEPLARTSGR